MAYISREERMDKAYKKVEALYHKGYDAKGIMRATGLNKLDTIDIMQKVFYMNVRKTALY